MISLYSGPDILGGLLKVTGVESLLAPMVNQIADIIDSDRHQRQERNRQRIAFLVEASENETLQSKRLRELKSQNEKLLIQLQDLELEIKHMQ